MTMTPKEILAFCREKEVRAVDLRFLDFPGYWQHTTIPATSLTESTFTDGIGFDGSSIRGWRNIFDSDMLLIPQPDTRFLDPFARMPTLAMICDVRDPLSGQDYTRDPRNVARKAAAYLQQSGIGDAIQFGPEAEFFVFDDVRFDQTPHSSYYYVDSNEAQWNRGREERPNQGYKIRYREGYFPLPPTDQLMDIRNEMMVRMMDCGLEVECQHHEVATAGQAEIDLRYDHLVKMADQMMIYKYIVRNVAFRHGKSATFMPKPIFGDSGSGFHTHVSIWKDDVNLFAGDEYAGLSKMALHAIGGILEHGPAIMAFSNPTTNSYKRLTSGYEAPVLLDYSRANRSAAIRIPMYSDKPNSKRIEFRCPDPSCNPYLTFAAITMAAIDGIQRQLDPGPSMECDSYELSIEERKRMRPIPQSLEEALGALERDHEFLLAGEVFTQDVVTTWIDYKLKREVEEIRMRPHPFEFCMYYDL
jgi:glutamine synthetase